MADDAIIGGCICGRVRYEFPAAAAVGGGHCHCVNCRRISGAARSSWMIMRRESVKLSGEIRFYDYEADSGNIVRHGFCPQCGSAVWNENSGWSGKVMLAAGGLDNPERFHPQAVVYAARSPSWGKTDESLPVFAEMPPPESSVGKES